MFSRVFPLFIIVPILELWVLFKIAGVIGFLPTLLMVICTAVIGVNLLRQQGLSTLMRFQKRVQSAQIPMQEMAEGLMLFFAGGMLLTPGVITDCFGFLLLVPVVRQALAKKLGSVMSANVQMGGVNMGGVDMNAQRHNSASIDEIFQQRSSQSKSGDVIEGEYEDLSNSESDNKPQ